MKVGKTRRYNPKKKGSYEVELWLFDWECSSLIGAIRKYLDLNLNLPQAHRTFLRKLEFSLSKALSKLLKKEFKDLK